MAPRDKNTIYSTTKNTTKNKRYSPVHTTTSTQQPPDNTHTIRTSSSASQTKSETSSVEDTTTTHPDSSTTHNDVVVSSTAASTSESTTTNNNTSKSKSKPSKAIHAPTATKRTTTSAATATSASTASPTTLRIKTKPASRKTTMTTTMTPPPTLRAHVSSVNNTAHNNNHNNNSNNNHTTISAIDRTATTTPQTGRVHSDGGVDHNLVIVGAILGGLILLVLIVAAILCMRRSRHTKKTARRKPPTTLTFSGLANGGMIDSPSSATINFSERLELIREKSPQSGEEGAVSFKNNGTVAYRKEEEEQDEYIAIWAVDEIKDQQGRQRNKDDNNDNDTHNHRQQQQSDVQISKCVETPRDQPDNKIVISHPKPSQTSANPSPRTICDLDLELEQNVYANFAPDGSSSLRSNHATDKTHAGKPSPPSDLKVDQKEQAINPDQLTTSTSKSSNSDDLPPDNQLQPSNTDHEENIYENYRPSSVSTENNSLSSPNSNSDIRQRESVENGCRVNDGYVDDNEEHSNKLTTPSQLEQDSNTIEDNNTTTTANRDDESPDVTKSTDRTIEPPQTQTSIPTENYYEGEEPDPHYHDNQPSSPILSRDSGIDADHDGDNNDYDVPSALLDRLRSHNTNNPSNTSARRSENSYVIPSLITRTKNHSPTTQKSKPSESDYYMSPSADDENIQTRPSELQDHSNYENTKIKRPDTYMAPDDLEQKSPTDEDELMKIYDNFELKAQNTPNPNFTYYETPEELERIYEMPTSARSSIQIPETQNESQNQNPSHLQKALASSTPTGIARTNSESALLTKSSSQDSGAGSEYEEPGYHTEPATPRATRFDTPWSPQPRHISSQDSHYVNSPDSALHSAEMEEAEYHTPKDISQSPFFQNIDKNKTAKAGIRTLPPAFKPPPPRLYKSTSLEVSIDDKRDQHQNKNNTNTRAPGESHHPSSHSQSLPRLSKDPPSKPTRKPANVKSLTIDTKNIGSPKIGRKKAALPIEKSSPLFRSANLSSSQSLNDIHEGEEEPSNIYLSPRSSPKTPKFPIGSQGARGPDTATEKDLHPSPKQRKISVPGMDNAKGNVDMNELQTAMQRRGLKNQRL